MRQAPLTQAEKVARFERFLLDNPESVRLSDLEPVEDGCKVRYINRKGATRSLRKRVGTSD